MIGDISFDTIMSDDEDWDVMEGCYRLPSGDWTVFIITRWWYGQPAVDIQHVFSSGVVGVYVDHPKDKALTKRVVRRVLSDLLGVAGWRDVVGPDSLTLK